MRVPASLGDRRLLEDEPFASSFSQRHAASKKQVQVAFLEKVFDRLENEGSCYRAVEAWRRLAFDPDDSQNSRDFGLRRREDGSRQLRSGQKPKNKPTIKMIKCFVKFYWYLYCGLDAMKFLSSQRFDGWINKHRVPRIKEEPVDDPMDEPMSPLTELSDSDEDEDDTPLLVLYKARRGAVKSSPIAPVETNTGERRGHVGSAVKVQELPVVLAPQRRVNDVVALSVPVHNESPPAVYKMSSEISAPTSESILLTRTPTTNRVRRPPVQAAPERRRPGRPPTNRPLAPALPASSQTSLRLLPGGSMIGKLRLPEAPQEPRRLPTSRPQAPALPRLIPDGSQLRPTMHHPLPRVPELPVSNRMPSARPLPRLDGSMMGPTMYHTSHRVPEPPTLLTPPVPDEYHLWQRHRRFGFPFPVEDRLPYLRQEIQIKPEPFEEDLDLDGLQLFDPADAPENWLTLPAIHTDNVIPNDEPQVLKLTIKPPKPALERLPPIWAKSRQEVCEALEWFRSYQGGVYQKNGIVKGYFLSAFSADRDCFECGGKLIISHGGGKAESSHKQRGQVTSKAAADQTEADLSVKALIKNYREGQPVALLIDDKYAPFPFDLGSQGVYMTVLGFYRIIHMWAEYQPSGSCANGRVVRYKFAFQWCEGQGEPWWSKDYPNDEDSSPSNEAPPVIETTQGPIPADNSPLKPHNLYFRCSTCDKMSPRVFQQAWACLDPTCRFFWIGPSGYSLPVTLDYNPEFLTIIDHRPIPFLHRGMLFPKPPVLAPKDGITTSYAATRGWHCRKCGRLSCRAAWELYQCPHCKDTFKITGIVRPAKALLSIPLPVKFTDSSVDEWSGIKRSSTIFFNLLQTPGATGQYQTFELPDGKGKIHLIKTNRMGNVEADRIFEAYQQQASEGTLLFRRWPLRSHKLRGPLLTNYFSQNSGETYHYVGGTDNTVPFDRAPSAVLQARDLIEKRIQEALGSHHRFNEVLSAAYMEQQKMAFHSDSEVGLGPVVAGLSMGSPALMHFRLLSKYAPLGEQRANALTVVLRHGDVCVMEGAGVQDFYEHTVVPCNFRIAATARWIQPHHAIVAPAMTV
ncbi:hypothetical protein DFH06DRAFT_1209378 [Mycena polygramma]|nr:hypothetical protein DFH06DRAFT_1209378 [Mycena polygramma]